MAIAFRADLQPFLADFIEEPRGLRTGRMFGLPAGHAGRRIFVCLLAPVLEMAARDVAEAV